MNIDRFYRIVKQAGVDVDKARDLLLDRDWTEEGMAEGEHEAWIEESTDDAIIEWLWHVIDRDEVFG